MDFYANATKTHDFYFFHIFLILYFSFRFMVGFLFLCGGSGFGWVLLGVDFGISRFWVFVSL